MRIQQITDYLESIAPLAYQESYDNSGLIVGNKQQEAARVLVTLDCTEAVVEEAIREGCGLIVAHHPIVFSGLKKFNGNSYVERVIIKAIRHNIAIYAIHTNYDNVHNGVNNEIAARLGLVNRKILLPKNGLLKKLVTFTPNEQHEAVRKALFEAGAGHIGNYSETSFNSFGTGTFKGGLSTNPAAGEAGRFEQVDETRLEVVFPAVKESAVVNALLAVHPYEEVAYDIYNLDNAYRQVGSGMVGDLPEPMPEMAFLEMVKDKLNTRCIRHTALMHQPVSKVALCGGSGRFLLHKAISAGAQVFISSDFKYHEFFDAEGRILIADVGHFESEQFTKDLLIRQLSEKFPTFDLLLSKENTNPVNYF
jgi:dinuclear metal center YbgI/SA1388 family protein